MAKSLLTNLDTLEVSLVGRGANKRTFAIRKAGETTMEIDKVTAAILEAPFEYEDKVEAVLKAEPEMDASAKKQIKQALKLLSAFKDQLSGPAFKTLAGIVGFKQLGEDGAPSDEYGMTEKALKGLSPDAKAQIEALWKANRDEIKKREELETVLKAERDANVRKQYVAKAAAEYAHVPGITAEKLGMLLKSLNDTSKADAEQLEAVLKSVEAAIVSSELFKSNGHTQGIDENSPEVKLDKLAKDLVSKSEGGLKYHQAYEKVLKTHPELYAEHRNSKIRR